MPSKIKTGVLAYRLVTAAAFAVAITILFVYTPTEKTMGAVQKLFYIHMPAAICTFIACLTAFVGGIEYLWRRKMKWDDLSAAAAKVAVLMCSIVLITGMIWGKKAWGSWWTWTPRLTFSLMLWLLYVVYLIIRPAIESGQRRALICSVYAIVAFLDVPLVYLSARLLPDLHPSTVELIPEMKITLMVWFVPVTLLTIGLIVAGKNSHRRKRERRTQLRSDQQAWAEPKQ